MSRLGEMLKAKRESMGMSLRDFAKICGMSHAYIKNIEDGDPRTGKDIIPSLSSIKKLAPALGITVEELLREIGYVQSTNDKLNPPDLEAEGADKSYKETDNRDCFSYIKEDLISFVTDPQSEEYLRLAKELKDKDINIDLIRSTIFESGKNQNKANNTNEKTASQEKK